MYIMQNDIWYLERVAFVMGGTVTLISALLAYFVSIWWLLLTVFAAINLIIFGLTGFCVGANILFRLGLKPRLQK